MMKLSSLIVIPKFLKGIIQLLMLSWVAGATMLFFIYLLLMFVDYFFNTTIQDSIISLFFSFNFWIMNIILCLLSFIYVFIEMLFTKYSKLYELYVHTFLNIFNKDKNL